MEEYLARVEVHKNDTGTYTARVWSETEGEKELTAPDLDQLFRELTMDLEFVVGGEADGPAFTVEEEFENMEFEEGWD